MEQAIIPHLCGGTLFALMLQARKPRRKARDKQNGGTDNLTAKDLFAGLTKVLTGEDVPAAGGTLAKCASLYKTCQESGGIYVPFTDPATASSFDSAVKTKNPATYARMTEFIETYLNQKKCEWLVRALIDTIQQDTSIPETTEFDADYYRPIGKNDLDRGVDGVVLQPFLMSVLHYVVMNAPDAESGRPTFETWFRQSGKKTEWKYCGSIGERIHPMKVVMSDYETDSPDVDFPEEDDDEAAEIMKRVPFVVQQIAPDLSTILDSKIYMIDEDLLEDDEEEPAAGQILPFSKYLKGASDFYSDKKTLLNPEEPRPFYDLYVCNDLKYHRQRYVGVRDTKPEITISDGTVQKLEAESKYIIIGHL